MRLGYELIENCLQVKWHDGEQVPQEVDEDNEKVDIVAEDGEHLRKNMSRMLSTRRMTRLGKRRKNRRTNFVYIQKPQVVEFCSFEC